MKYEDNLYLSITHKYGQIVFLIKVVCNFTLLCLGLYLTYSMEYPLCLIAQFLLGALFAHMIELQHEALHGATEWGALNRALGFLLGLPMLIAYSDYQYNHMLHHQYIGTDKDTEFFNYSEDKTLSLTKFLLGLFMFEHYVTVIKKLAMQFSINGIEVNKANIKRKINQEYQWLLLILILGAALSLCYQSDLMIKLWLLPLFLFAAPIHFLIELPEHVFCERNTASMYLNTRTIKSNGLMSWFVNGNNFHVEHHYAPNHPIALLSQLHKEHKSKIVYLEESYLNFYKKFIKKILDKS